MKREKGTAGRFFARFSRLIYHLIAVSFIGKFFTSYSSCNGALTGARRGFGKRHVRVGKRYTVRRALACAMEQNILSRTIRRVLAVLSACSLRTYGFFLTVLGAVWIALYGVSLFVSLGSIVGWVHLISGGISLLIGIMLLFSDRSVGASLRGDTLLGTLLFRVLGVPDDLVKEAKQHGAQHYLFASLLAFLVAALGLLIMPLSMLAIVCCLLLALIVLSVPEAGLLLAFFFLPFSKLMVGSDFLTVAFLLLSLVGYVGKLLRGNRSFRVELQDIPVLLFILLFFLSGYSVSPTNVWLDVWVRILLALAYLMVVNMLSTPQWMLTARVAVATSASLAALFGIGQLLLATFTPEGATIFDIVSHGDAVTAGFLDHRAFAYYLVIAFAFVVPVVPFVGKRYRALTLFAALLIGGAAVLTFTSVTWLALALIIVVLLLVYECRSFPVLFLGSGAVTATLLLIPDTARFNVLGVFHDLTDPAAAALRAGGRGVVSRIFFESGSLFSQMDQTVRFFFGAGYHGLAVLHPYYAEPMVGFTYAAYNHWQLLLVDYGIFGIVVAGLFYLILLQNCFSVLAMAEEHDRPLFAFIGIAMTAALILFDSFTYVWYDYAATGIYFMASALIAAALRYGRHRREKITLLDEVSTPTAELDYRVRAPRAAKQKKEG